MKKLLFLLMAMLPLAAQAQYFTPDLPEDRGLYLFLQPDMGSMHHEWMIMSGEKMLVEKVGDNGWCRIKYVNKEGKEYVGFNKMNMLKPLDDTAVAMKETAIARKAKEHQIIYWGGVLLAIGLLLSFMKFLGKVRTVLLYAVIMLLSVLEIWFLKTTDGWTVYLPAVVGWKWAAIWFTVLLVFIAGQAIVFYQAIMCFEHTRGVFGMPFVLAFASAWCALLALILSLFWPSIEQYVAPGLMVAIGVCIVYFFINVLIKDGIVNALLTTPLFAVGIAALLLMLVDVVIVLVCGSFLLPILKGMFSGGKGGKTILDDMGSKKQTWFEKAQAERARNS